MQLIGLMEKMKMDHLAFGLDTLCDQAGKRELGYREFLLEALQAEWQGRHQRGTESRLSMARFPWVKTLDQFDMSFQPSIDKKVIRHDLIGSRKGRKYNPAGAARRGQDTWLLLWG